jgi:hypothetical protein
LHFGNYLPPLFGASLRLTCRLRSMSSLTLGLQRPLAIRPPKA